MIRLEIVGDTGAAATICASATAFIGTAACSSVRAGNNCCDLQATLFFFRQCKPSDWRLKPQDTKSYQEKWQIIT